jgi:hypothetical protein
MLVASKRIKKVNVAARFMVNLLFRQTIWSTEHQT